MRKEFYIFGAENVGKMISKLLWYVLCYYQTNNLEASLEWDTFEQICVWQLLNSEEPPVLSVVSILPDLCKSGFC